MNFQYPRVTSALLDDIVRRLIEAGAPSRIILFGSRARGDFRDDSDLDLLIVEESDLPRYRRSPRYYLATAGLFPARDIVVWTPQEIAEWDAVPNAFVTTAVREGKVLYEK
ncbi:MAG: nucleotidyltransferase domain-containing protein [Candidatus Sericytochromatia bacterium]|nr:nucleotidyltransferase domain-containing protein [Candidatus Tanganyikabacteria bacterium]